MSELAVAGGLTNCECCGKAIPVGYMCCPEYLKLKAKVQKLNKTFRHYHFSYGKDDACDKCGLDLRDEIHKRG